MHSQKIKYNLWEFSYEALKVPNWDFLIKTYTENCYKELLLLNSFTMQWMMARFFFLANEY